MTAAVDNAADPQNGSATRCTSAGNGCRFTDASAPTDKAIWLLLGGVALTLVGAVGSLRPFRNL